MRRLKERGIKMALIKSRLEKLEAVNKSRGVRFVRARDPKRDELIQELESQGFEVIVVETGVTRDGAA